MESTASPQSNAKVVIITALISALSTVSISVVPKLIGDSDPPPQIAKLAALEKPAWRISGSVVRDVASREPMTNAGVYLVRDPVAVATTNDTGRFAFPDVAPGNYSIIVRDQSDPRSCGRGLIIETDPPAGEIEVQGARIHYRIDD
jgi:Carboxypeptidase regulatory-like domain